MKKNILLFIALAIFVSCQQDESGFVDRTEPLIIEDAQTAFQEMGAVHTSIMESDWWKNLHPTTQMFLSLELSRDEEPITMNELQNVFEKSREISQTRGGSCPGYPIANPEGDVTLHSQADVIAFGALNCKKVTGKLEIIDTLGSDPICDLSPLKGIKEVGSNLTINADCLTNLSGLEKVKSIGMNGPFGFIGVLGSSLVDISALSKVNTITGSLNIIDCDMLTSTSTAFTNITNIGSGQTSAAITSIYVLNVNDNASLTDMSSLSNLTNIEGGLRILNNGALLNLDDLSGLNTIGDDIFILDNAALQNVNELSNITSIADDLFVFDNPSLSQCCGFYNLVCSDSPTCSVDGVGDLIAIFNNSAGCNSDVEIITNGPCL